MEIAGGGGGGGGPITAQPVQAGQQPAQAGQPNTGASQAIIPDAGVYGAETAAALNAYNNAVAQATAQRNALYNQYGLLNTGAVDPNNPYGQYQQMLDQQAKLYQADQEDAAARHLGTGGLANQQLSADTRDSLAQDFGFQQQVAQAASDYQNALAAAKGTQQSADSQAYQDALNTALQNQLSDMTSGNYTAPGTGKQAASTPAKQSKQAQHQAQQHHAVHHAIHRAIQAHARRAGSRHHSGR